MSLSLRHGPISIRIPNTYGFISTARYDLLTIVTEADTSHVVRMTEKFP